MAKRKFELPGIQDFSKEQEKVRPPGEYKLSVKDGSTYLEVRAYPRQLPTWTGTGSLLAGRRTSGW